MVKKTYTGKKRKKEIPSIGKAYITSSFNNTIVTITDHGGNTLCWGSCGTTGFKGARKSTPYAATTTAMAVARKAVGLGLKNLAVFVKGPGSGRDAAVKALKVAGLEISSITDITPIPHNGCRQKKRRRV